MNQVSAALSDAEQLLQQANKSSGQKAAALREHGMDLLKQAREDVRTLQAGGGTGQLSVEINAIIRKRPWCALASAIAMGILLGLLLTKPK
ncbi:DUF883 family protein [Cupriavidus numazuensis]|uniref:DUF883 domain-containing protein n=1 Tax=Cupriavidus numazuensis TaxID=221992 RepID=A0ABN7Q932_9BURK|nr:DUF883 family protein [Cupriavidus numazuensis]CAG2155322.1 hypothetical protein LMG26411_04883 [Cupriavidus numazuensis]